AETVGDRAEFVFELLIEALDEVAHHVVVEQLAELRLLEAIAGILGMSYGNVALRRSGKQDVAGRTGEGHCEIERKTASKDQRGAAKLFKTQSTTPCRKLLGGVGWVGFTRHDAKP